MIRAGTLREWPLYEKEEWGPGPWQGEPDSRVWVDDPTGLPCAMVRTPVTGAWCGYVALVPGHRVYRYAREETMPARREGEKLGDYWTRCGARRRTATTGYDVIGEFVRCHGGLTYCGKGSHITPPRSFTRLRWVGFDCAHFMDVSPAIDALVKRHSPEFSTQTRSMRDKLNALAEVGSHFKSSTYKDCAYVQAECEQLAADLNALGPRATWRVPGGDPVARLMESLNA